MGATRYWGVMETLKCFFFSRMYICGVSFRNLFYLFRKRNGVCVYVCVTGHSKRPGLDLQTVVGFLHSFSFISDGEGRDDNSVVVFIHSLSVVQ